MEFCSKYGYDYGFHGSDSEDVSDEEGDSKKKVIHKVRKADTNIISVKFDQLVEPNEMFAGDPVVCKSCTAIMTSLSRSSVKEEEFNGKKENFWKCEFCGEKNKLISGLEEIPKKDDVTFLLEPAPKVEQRENAAASTEIQSLDNNLLTFCIDVSGSMDTYIEKTSTVDKNNQALNKSPSCSSFESITRLQGVKVACAENLSILKEKEPNKKVSLVTFSDSVKFYGDCTNLTNNEPLLKIPNEIYGGGYGISNINKTKQKQIKSKRKGSLLDSLKSKAQQAFSNILPAKESKSDDDKSDDEDEISEPRAGPTVQVDIPREFLENKEKMLEFAARQSAENLKSIKEAYLSLEARVNKLRTEGSTALGPGLVFSVGFCSRRSGSQIILCTDGAANVGMGSLNSGFTNQKEEGFYEELAQYARDKGITVNVITMEGTDCKLAMLGKVADITNGTVNIVNPLNLSEQFKSILENRIVATGVKAKLIVNQKYLYVRDDELEKAEAKLTEANETGKAARDKLNKIKKSIVSKDIGSANVDTEITFEYGLRKLEKADEKFQLQKMPFQLQISYTSADGSKAVRVYTKEQEFTKDRHLAEQNVAFNEVLFSHAAQKTSANVISSNIGYAQRQLKAYEKLQQANNWVSTAGYANNACALMNIDKSKKFEELEDQAVECVYKGRKMNKKMQNLN